MSQDAGHRRIAQDNPLVFHVGLPRANVQQRLARGARDQIGSRIPQRLLDLTQDSVAHFGAGFDLPVRPRVDESGELP